MSLEALSDATGISVSFLNRIENQKRELNLSNLTVIARALSAAHSDILMTGAVAEEVIVKGAVQAGEWAENPEWPQDDWYSLAVPFHPSVKGIPRFGAEVRGPSMNRVYPEGTVLVWIEAQHDPEPMREGARYIVRRESPDGTYETTVKTYKLSPDGSAWLVPESDDPAYQTPLAWHEQDHVQVLGRVIQSVRNE